jgi:hypothetical protein
MLYGGFDISGYSLSRLEILNIVDMNVEVIELHTSSEFPQTRGFHNILKMGSILVLYGGKTGSGQNLNDLWKFIIFNKKWMKVNEVKDDMFYLYKSKFIFTKMNIYERPVLFGGEDNNREITNDLIVLDFDICLTDTNILDATDCLPCSEGYELNRQKKCGICNPGYYHNINSQLYSISKCEECSIRTYNDLFGQTECKICPFGTFSNNYGLSECKPCDNLKVCLPGSDKPINDDFIITHVNDNYVQDENYAEYIDTNSKIKKHVIEYGLMIVSGLLVLMLLLLAILYKIKKRKLIRFLICMDFIVLTGGYAKKCNGGLITLIYSLLILSLSLSFIFRYIYLNEHIEQIPLSHLANDQAIMESSLKLEVDLIGYPVDCIDNKSDIENLYTCSKQLDISPNGMKKYYCSKTKDGYCRVAFICEDCNTLNNTSIVSIGLNNPNSFIQAFKWNFDSVWNIGFDKSKGYSKIYSIFKPDNNIK